MQSAKYSLTEGSIWKSMLMFALPVFMGNLLQQFYNTFDSWVVGHFIGATALAAVSSSAPLIFLLIGFFNGMSLGAGVVIAQFFGARDKDSLSKAIHTDVALGLAAGLFLTVVGVLFSPIILRWMGTPADVMEEAIQYFRYYFLGSVFTVMYNISVGILHAVGDSRHPLYYLIFSTAVNVVLDLLFVAVFHWGVGSAAMATTISQGVSALLCIIHLTRTQEVYHLDLRSIRFHWNSLRSIFRIGFPSGVQNSMISVANVVVQASINGFGSAAMAGCGVYSRLEGFVFLPIICFGQALSTFISQNLGAQHYHRVKKGAVFGICCCLAIAELTGLIFYFFAPHLIRIFNSSPDVVDFGVRHMRTICLFFFLVSFSHAMAAVFRGAGRASVPMFTMLICWCVIRITYITVALQFFPRLETVSWAYPITWTLSSITFLIYYKKSGWLEKRIQADSMASQSASY